jgi:hypothetical protein
MGVSLSFSNLIKFPSNGNVHQIKSDHFSFILFLTLMFFESDSTTSLVLLITFSPLSSAAVT